MNFEIDCLVALAERPSAFRVANLDQVAPHVSELSRRNLARPGAAVAPVSVLGSDENRAALGKHLSNSRDRRERRDDERQNVGRQACGPECTSERTRVLECAVHLPTGAQPPLPRHVTPLTLPPGSGVGTRGSSPTHSARLSLIHI